MRAIKVMTYVCAGVCAIKVMMAIQEILSGESADANAINIQRMYRNKIKGRSAD